jgi:hypothetical protein
MKIVIDIPKEYYDSIKEIPVEQSTADMLIIRTGTPLPKGHGRLIDADEAIKVLKSLGSRDYRREKGTIQDAIKMLSYDEYTSTIIEADNGNEKQVTGRWIRKMDVYRGGYVECSVCGTPYKCIEPKKMKTCMVCHARMEESE